MAEASVEPLLPEPILTRLHLALLLHGGASSQPSALHSLVADTLNNRGVARMQAGALDEALRDYDGVLAVVPAHSQALNNRGALLTELGQTEAALADFERSLTLRPGNPNAWSNQGNAEQQRGAFDAAIACYERALALDAGHLDARMNRGIALQALRRFDAALADFALVLAARPEHAAARYNTSLVHLAKGDYAAGWVLHEARWELASLRGDWRAFTVPQWRGDTDPAGKTVLLWAEQGLGDTLQFCRYAALLAERATVVLEVPRSLVRLMGSLPGVAQVVAMGDPLPAFELHCPLMSLPLAFGTRIDTIPDAVPYLREPPADATRWRERVAALPGLRVGLVWAGNPRPTNPSAHAIDRRRSMRLADLAVLGAIPGVSLVSLQKQVRADDVWPDGLAMHDWTSELDDFADTAALVAALDLVITVDTAMVHLAGTLGRPVWVLNRFDACWRWLEGRDDSPWYPTARLFTQAAPGEWAGVVAAVGTALGRLSLQFLHDAANAQMRDGDWAAALGSIEAVLWFTPGRPDALANRAAALDHLGREDEALASLDGALASDPDHVLARRNRAGIAYRQGRLQAARDDLDYLLRLRDDDADALMQRGAALYALGDGAAALADLRAADALRPDHVATLANLGLVLESAGELEAALDCCDRALAVDPHDAAALLNRGVVLGRKRRGDEALACYDAVLATRPDDANAAYNASLLHLARGEYAIGWRLHEARWRSETLRGAARGFAQPQWRGEAIAPGRTILLHAEQGLGDTLQFCRYVPEVARQADVVLEVPASLCRLLAGLPCVRAVVAQGDKLPAFDLHCPLMSLPLAFGTALATIPGPVPYLRAAPKAVQAWRRRLKALPGLRVGLVWAGRSRASNATLRAIDGRRSMRLADFAPLAAVPRVAFVSLQKGPAAGEVREAPAGLVVHDWTEELGDFADTAALVAALDVVVTVDTAVAHLAGALGRPVWVLNRYDACWRWLEGRADSPWYPSARLFRQREAGDWGDVVAEVGEALGEVGAAARRAGRGAAVG